MCPCPFCATVAVLLMPLLFWKKARKWLSAKIKKHHDNCDVCQKAEHQASLKNKTTCHCKACRAKKKSTKRKKTVKKK